MYDVIVVGARCAGASTAMLLARKGYRVLMVDKSTFPSDIMSTHYIHQSGVAHLKKWGVLDQVVASNCPPITKILYDVGPFALTGNLLPVDGVAEAYCPRRRVIDTILVKAAMEAGAQLYEGFTVQELLMDGERVTGIRGHTTNGTIVTEHAHIVIGADGLHSIVARAVQAATYNEQPALTTTYYTYWSGVPLIGLEGYTRDNRFIICFPTNDQLSCIGVQWTRQEFQIFRSNIDGNYMNTLKLAPDLAERVAGGKREERYVGTVDLPNFFRKPYGAGWALVGDAGYHQDPNTGLGISNAFRDADFLAAAVDAGLSAKTPMDKALAEYEQKRNAVAMPLYDLTCKLASLAPPPPDMQQLLAALHGNQKDTEQFLGIIPGAVTMQDFYADENIKRIMAEAQARQQA